MNPIVLEVTTTSMRLNPKRINITLKLVRFTIQDKPRLKNFDLLLSGKEERRTH